MSTRLTWLGHGGWKIETGGHSILLDPFLTDSPVAPLSANDVDAEFILVSHGHFDHVADVASIANRCQAQVISNFEIAEWFRAKHQVQNTLGMNLGGGIDLSFGRVQLTVAHHSSQLPDGSYGGNPAGFLLKLAGCTIYFACDTALFGDMRLLRAQEIDLAVVPIGDLFTMGPDDSIEAIKLIEPRHAAPAHYNTWPPIEQDASAWAERVSKETAAAPIVVAPGESFEL